MLRARLKKATARSFVSARENVTTKGGGVMKGKEQKMREQSVAAAAVTSERMSREEKHEDEENESRRKHWLGHGCWALSLSPISKMLVRLS